MGGMGWSELIIVFGLVLLLFGAKRIPELARSLGKAKREFQKAQKDIFDDSTKENCTASSIQKDIIPEQQKDLSKSDSSLDKTPSSE
jgi:sec-independent protein translocase protein TatA